MLKQIMRVDDARNGKIDITLRLEREIAFVPLAKIGAEKCAHPGPTTFRNGKENGIAARQLARATTEISTDQVRAGSDNAKIDKFTFSRRVCRGVSQYRNQQNLR